MVIDTSIKISKAEVFELIKRKLEDEMDIEVSSIDAVIDKWNGLDSLNISIKRQEIPLNKDEEKVII